LHCSCRHTILRTQFTSTQLSQTYSHRGRWYDPSFEQRGGRTRDEKCAAHLSTGKQKTKKRPGLQLVLVLLLGSLSSRPATQGRGEGILFPLIAVRLVGSRSRRCPSHHLVKKRRKSLLTRHRVGQAQQPSGRAAGLRLSRLAATGTAHWWLQRQQRQHTGCG